MANKGRLQKNRWPSRFYFFELAKPEQIEVKSFMKKWIFFTCSFTRYDIKIIGVKSFDDHWPTGGH